VIRKELSRSVRGAHSFPKGPQLPTVICGMHMQIEKLDVTLRTTVPSRRYITKDLGRGKEVCERV